jgi:deoxyribonuclease V
MKLSTAEAAALQQKLRSRVCRRDDFGQIRYVAGGDLAFDLRAKLAYAAVIVFRFPSLEEVERCCLTRPVEFPYIPGLLAFREAPALFDAVAGLRRRPDLMLVDGHGYAHPRRFGLASHLGLALDIPTIGCAKSVYIGTYGPLAPGRGSTAPLVDKGEVIGAALRTRSGVAPVFVSVGHRVSLAAATPLVLACLDGFRIPRPTRLADQVVGELKREPGLGSQV